MGWSVARAESAPLVTVIDRLAHGTNGKSNETPRERVLLGCSRCIGTESAHLANPMNTRIAVSISATLFISILAAGNYYKVYLKPEPPGL